MNMSNINNFINVKNNILSNGYVHNDSLDIWLAKWGGENFLLGSVRQLCDKQVIKIARHIGNSKVSSYFYVNYFAIY